MPFLRNVPTQELAGKSPLSMLAGCLDAAFQAAHSIDSPQLQGSSCLGWTLMPEVQQVVSAYSERFLEQVGAQVKLWTVLKACTYCCFAA